MLCGVNNYLRKCANATQKNAQKTTHKNARNAAHKHMLLQVSGLIWSYPGANKNAVACRL